MAQRTQRVERLLQEFLQYHKEGFSIPEIASIFQVDLSTVYNYLQEIADSNGVTRDSLLERPFVSYNYQKRCYTAEDKLPIATLKNELDTLEKEIKYLLNITSKILTSKE